MVVIVEHVIVSLVESNIPWEVIECSYVFILYRGKTVEEAGFIWKMEEATCGFYLVPYTVRGHGVLELFKVQIQAKIVY